MIPTPDELERIIADEADKTAVWVIVGLNMIRHNLYQFPNAVLKDVLRVKIQEWKHDLDYERGLQQIEEALDEAGYTVTIEKDIWEYYIHIKVKEV